MARRFVDLSIALEVGVPSDPPGMEPKITYTRHADSVPQMARSFPGLTAEDLPDGEGWAVETVTISTHNGTHMDAPWHFHSTTDHGARPAPAIDETPLDLCLRPGVKLDFRGLPDGYVATAADVEAELARIGHALQPLDIVLVNTRAGSVFGQPEYIHAGCGMGREATLYLTERGVRVVGTDAWSWDAPFSHTARRWAEDRDPKIIWEGHKAGREIPYWQMEKLSNLEALPAFGFEVACFPVKIKGASAGWTRAVAIFED
ncbi:cyclase family protein [Caulobacter sp. KR2-114]|uniref:cyclase family protein n=1 Tax=Caulobacter sp. KR2-114 TaxID=3400912 RepID=UPI003C0FF300